MPSIMQAIAAAAERHPPQADKQAAVINLEEHGLPEAAGMLPLELQELIKQTNGKEYVPIQVANDDDMLGALAAQLAVLLLLYTVRVQPCTLCQHARTSACPQPHLGSAASIPVDLQS